MNFAQQNISRLFVAFEIPSEAKRELAQIISKLNQACNSQRTDKHSIKWVKAEGIHLTTQFLGDIENSHIQEIKRTITDVHERSDKRAFILKSNTIGAFPNLARPRVIWTDLSGADIERMKTFVSAVSKQLIAIRCLSETKNFKPHLTLGRIRRGSQGQSLQTIADAVTFSPIEITFGALTLFSSELTPKGPIHTALQRWNLESYRK